MKITLDFDDDTLCVFVNYVTRTADGLLMGCKSLDSGDLKDGAAFDVRPPKPKE